MALLDDFNRADSDLGAPNWTVVGFPPSVVSNAVEFAGGLLLAAAWSDTFAADQEASVEVVQRSDAGYEFQVWLRGSSDFSQDNGVIFRFNFGATGVGDDIISVKDAWTGTVLGELDTGSVANGDVYLVRVVGTTAEVYRNGGLVLTVTDAGMVAGAGNVYLSGNGDSATPTRLDNFSGGDVAAAAGGPGVVRMSLPVLGLPPLS